MSEHLVTPTPFNGKNAMKCIAYETYTSEHVKIWFTSKFGFVRKIIINCVSTSLGAFKQVKVKI